MPRVLTDVWSKKGVKIGVESFGRTLQEAIEELYTGIAYGVEKYGWQVENPNPCAESPTPPAAKGPIEKKPVQKTPVEGQINTSAVERIKVTPQPEQKAELAIFFKGHAFADMHYTATVADLVQRMAATNIPWEESDFTVANEFRCEFVVKWKESKKLNTKGNPYRDIVEFLPAGSV